jgi:hypothetical protein
MLGLIDPVEVFYQSGLARSVVADQRDAVSVVDIEVDFLEGGSAIRISV